MARKIGQIIRRGSSTWLVRIYVGRDPETQRFWEHLSEQPVLRPLGFPRTRLPRHGGWAFWEPIGHWRPGRKSRGFLRNVGRSLAD
jgi:hypothetical protein